jgi:predicted O-methyltransferase YrrM
MPDDSTLLAVLESLRERGALGEPSIPRAITHAEAFVAPIPGAARRLIDLGSGGGLPGLVVAVRRPMLSIVLTERRERRGDLLRLACTRLGLEDRVSVFVGDVVALAKQASAKNSFDVVTARAFGDPLWTLRCAVPFLSPTGIIVVSEPPVVSIAERWPIDDVGDLGLRRIPVDEFAGVRCFERVR